MRIEQLQYLCDIKQTRSINKTAEHFFISQQAVSHSIKKLETELECTLLNRLSVGVEITPEGEIVVQYAEHILNTVEDMKSAVRKNQADVLLKNKILNIYSNSVIFNDIISLMKPQNEKVKKMAVVQMEVSEIFHSVAEGNCDLAVASLDRDRINLLWGKYSEFVKMKILVQDVLVACCMRGSAPAMLQSISAEDYDSYSHSIFAVIPKEEHSKIAYQSVGVLNDLTFHQNLLQKKRDHFVIMPRIAYQLFFQSRKYVAVPLQVPTDMVHVLILPKESSDEVLQFAQQIEKEFQQL